MVYSMNRQIIEVNKELLDQIKAHAVQEEAYEIKIERIEDLSKAAYKVHELLYNAKLFPRDKVDAALRDMLKVQIKAERCSIVVTPKRKAEAFKSVQAAQVAPDSQDAVRKLSRTSEDQETVEWAVKEDKMREGRAFLDAVEFIGWDCRLVDEDDKLGRHYMVWSCERTGAGELEEMEKEHKPKGAWDLLKDMGYGQTEDD